jgi:hypothetical protein
VLFRSLGPFRLVWSHPDYPSNEPGDPALCETHILARFEAADGAQIQPADLRAQSGARRDDFDAVS